MKRKFHFSPYVYILTLFSLISIIYVFFPRKTAPICANSISCTRSLELKVENNAKGIFNNQPVMPPIVDLSQEVNKNSVLGESSPKGEKRVYVDLTHQTLSAYEGDTLFMQTFISSGKWFPTPPGDYTVWIKLRSTRMTGGVGADYYDLPNVPYVMFFYSKDLPKAKGYSLHGAYWHNNFGHPMSHGCVNMRIIDAQKLYDWINPSTTGNTSYADDENPGTKVTIYGKAP